MSLSSALCEFLNPPVISCLLAPNILHRTQHHVTSIHKVRIDLQAKGITMHCGSQSVMTLNLGNFDMPSARYFTHYHFWFMDVRSKHHAINYFPPPPHLPRKEKVKCTIVQALRLRTGRTAHRGSRGIALLFLGHGTRRGWGFSATPRPLFTPRKDPVPITQEAG